ncbi:Protein of unknown function [Actinacidiphila yanglinensis]|uniref:DUF4232 domain-containing protein n=1 Tax=Actinacidiphila yanglinensis TaxID=310779 RepID=A0A1H5TYM8_9ACTN|nr:DUF4232 domain-containing protein [Actinacidiphila yanglinensis]SEF67278.1 Protein of unknown function [Actinacidiphila yanglinensis]
MRTTRTVRTGTLVVMFATAGFALAACGSDASDTAASSSATSSSAASSSQPDPSSTSAGGATADPATVGGVSGDSGKSGESAVSGGSGATASAGTSVPACTTDQLRATAANFSSGAGSTGFQIVFQNKGSSPCSLSGYPGVSFVKIHNIQLGKAAARTSDTPATRVTLIPNAHAYADVRTVNGVGGYSAAQCDLTTVPTLRVYPPNQKESTNIPWNRQECVGSSIQNLQVGPVHGNK